MQVNSAQDYLTAQKRRIVAATFTQDPPPLGRRYNYVVTSVLANKASRYERTPYPQTLSIAAGTTPGLRYTTPGVRPTINNCCIVAQGATPLGGSLV
jgi:hypothetical protein